MSLPYNQVQGNTLVTSTLEGGQEKSVIIEFDKGGKIDSITYEGEKLDYRSEKFVQLLDNDKNVQNGFHHYNVEKGLINPDVVKFDDLEPVFFVSANVEKDWEGWNTDGAPFPTTYSESTVDKITNSYTEPIDNSEFGEEIKIDEPIIQQDKEGNITEYKVFYSETEGTTIRAVDANGRVKPGVPPIFKDGVFDRSQLTNDLSLFVPEQYRWSDPELENIYRKIQTATTEHINAVAPDTIKPAWVIDTEGRNAQSKKTFRDKNGLVSFIENAMWGKKEDYGRSKSNVGDGPGYAGGSGQGQRLMERTLSTFDGAAEDDMLFKKIVKYPMDMANNMDHMFIQCYSYQAPYAKTLDGKYGDGLLNPFKPPRKSGLAYGAERYRPYKKKLGAGIKMPMPNNMMDENGRNWNDESMSTKQLGAVQMASKNVIASTLTNDFGGVGPLARNLAINADLLTQTGTQGGIAAEKISQLAANTGLSADEIMQRSVGIIANSNTELLFAGVMLRSFEYQWTMSPRNRLEAANVRMIIRAFKQWSAPKKSRKADRAANTDVGRAGGPSFFLGTPNIFRLRFVTNGNRNILGVNKFKPCALTNVSLNYTPEGQWLAYENGMPIAVTMSLRFAELEPIYDTDYSEDVAFDRQYNPTDPNSLGDLYPISDIDQANPYTSDVGY